MPIRMSCPSCDHSFSVSVDLLGRRVKCPGCRQPVRVTDTSNKEDNDRPLRATKSAGRSGKKDALKASRGKNGLAVWLLMGGGLITISLGAVLIWWPRSAPDSKDGPEVATAPSASEIASSNASPPSAAPPAVLSPTHAPVHSASDQPSAPDHQSLSARDILDRMTQVYANCRSYRDSGTIQELIHSNSDGTAVLEHRFSTAFVRPDRFQMTIEATRGNVSRDVLVIWSSGDQIKKSWTLQPGIQRPISLISALSGSAGTTKGLSARVPPLLISTDVGTPHMPYMQDAMRVEDDTLENSVCFRIDGHREKTIETQEPTRIQTHTMLWVDQKTFLLRKIHEKIDINGSLTEEVTSYDPTIDQDVSEEQLQFTLSK
jgi:hypothetical protein